MGRLPWNNAPAYRGGHDDGGVEHLETDVMRFMAILAFCLVAIFALVQSMPLDGPTQTEPPGAPSALVEVRPPPAVTTVVPEPPVPVPAPTRASPPTPTPVPPAARTEPRPVVASAPREEPVTLVLPPVPAPRVQTQDRVAVASATPQPAPPAPVFAPQDSASVAPQQGFTLRFESDDALRALVAKDEVALYALASGKAWRAIWVDTRLTFRPAQVPPRIHEMTPQTVPEQAVQTLRRRVAVESGDVNWGVTLPTATSRELNAVLASASGGDLVIDADARLRLEPGT